MAHDDIPEDRVESYPCDFCEGNIQRNPWGLYGNDDWVCSNCGRIMGEENEI